MRKKNDLMRRGINLKNLDDFDNIRHIASDRVNWKKLFKIQA